MGQVKPPGIEYRINPSDLPECFLPAYLSPDDLAQWVERVIGHQQVFNNFKNALLRDGSGSGPGLATAVAMSGARLALESLDCMAPLTSDVSWNETIDRLTEEATLAGTDFAGKYHI